MELYGFFNLLNLNMIFILYVFLWVKLLILNEMMFICLNDNCEWIHFVLFDVVFFSISIISLLS